MSVSLVSSLFNFDVGGVVEFRIHQESTSKNFLIVPSSGLLPRSNGVYPQEISVIIEFVPT